MDKSLYNSVSQDKHTFYTQYINSRTWKLKRREILKRDNNECQTCCSKNDLQVHHRHYNNLGNEALADLITLCVPCHDAITSSIRFRRNIKKGVKMLATLEDRQNETIINDKEAVVLSGIDRQDRQVVASDKDKVVLKANRF